MQWLRPSRLSGQCLRTQAAEFEASAKAQKDYRKELIHGKDTAREMANAITDIPKAINLVLYRSRIGTGVPLNGGGGSARATYPRHRLRSTGQPHRRGGNHRGAGAAVRATGQ
jgi:hypothetical protein